MKKIVVFFLAALASGPLSAQTNDHNFRSFQWLEDIEAARPAGMAGAFVALADDSSATFLNPAGLTLLPKAEASAGLTGRRYGSLPVGDTTDSHTGIGFIGGGGRLTNAIAVGGYISQPQDERILLALTGLDHLDSGFLNTTVTEYGGAVSWRPEDRLHVGLRFNLAHLSLDGLLVHQVQAGRGGVVRVTMTGAQTKLTGQAGLLAKVSDALSLALAYTQGVRWDVDRAALVISAGSLPATTFQLSSPGRLSGGASYRASRRVTLVGQIDYVLYGRLHETLRIVSLPVPPSEYRLDNGVDFRAGAEVTFPRKRLSYTVRGGVYSQASSGLQFTATTPFSEASNFMGVGRQTVGTLGGSLETRAGLRFDVAGALGGVRTVLLAGATMKF